MLHVCISILQCRHIYCRVRLHSNLLPLTNILTTAMKKEDVIITLTDFYYICPMNFSKFWAHNSNFRCTFVQSLSWKNRWKVIPHVSSRVRHILFTIIHSTPGYYISKTSIYRKSYIKLQDYKFEFYIFRLNWFSL